MLGGGGGGSRGQGVGSRESLINLYNVCAWQALVCASTTERGTVRR